MFEPFARTFMTATMQRKPAFWELEGFDARKRHMPKPRLAAAKPKPPRQRRWFSRNT